MHLFAGDIETFEEEYIADEAPKNNNELEERLTKVEVELEELKTNFDKLMKELMG